MQMTRLLKGYGKWIGSIFMLFFFSTLAAQSGLIALGIEVAHPNSCMQADGQILISPLSGSPPFQYSINGGASFQSDSIFTNLKIGTYLLLVSDAENRFSSFTIVSLEATGAPSIEQIVMASPMKCGESGTIKIVAEGGLPPLQYSTDNGMTFQENHIFSPVLAGTYNLQVRNADSTCVVTYPSISFAPQNPISLLDIQVTGTKPICDSTNGKIAIRTTGGSGANLYSIDNGLTFQDTNVFENLAAGTYFIAVKDTVLGCEKTTNDALVLDAEECPTCDSLSIEVFSDDPTCDSLNGQIVILVTGGSGDYNYSIDDGLTFDKSPVFSGLGAGSYDIIVKDSTNNCEKGQEPVIDLSEIDCPNCDMLEMQSFIKSPTCDSLDGRIEFSIIGGSGVYQYSLNDGPFQNNKIFDNLGAGLFVLTVKDSIQNCEKSFSPINFSACKDDTLRIDTLIELGTVDTICFSELITEATVVSINPTCEGQNPAVGFEVNTLTNCLIYEGIGIGKDTICLEVCLSNNTCVEVLVTVTVVNSGCPQFLPDNPEVKLSDCDSLYTYCLTIPIDQIDQYAILLNGAIYSSGFTNCDKEGQTGITLGIGTHELIIASFDTECNDTTQINILCQPDLSVFMDTIMVNAADTFCIDKSELAGNPLSIQNVCEDQSGESVVFEIDTANHCITYAGVEAGTERACIVLCDDLGICDTTIIDILVEPEADTIAFPIAVMDIDTISESETIAIDVLENDTTNSDLIAVAIFEDPTHGTVTINSDNTISYMPNDTICNINDQFVYELCNIRGCDTAIVQIYIECKEFKIYNGFSPNGDGVNETFFIEGIEEFPNNQLKIVDRWGNRVYEQAGYKGQWDGTWNGKKLPDGTYFYFLDDGAGKTYSGFLQIHR